MILAGGDGPASLVPAGDPDTLRSASAALGRAAALLDAASGTVRSSIVPVSEWSGPAADQAGETIQALGAAHVVAADAMFAASQALAVYAVELEEAQNIGRQAQAMQDVYSALSARYTASTAHTVLGDGGLALGNPFGPGWVPMSSLEAQVDAARYEMDTLASHAQQLAQAAAIKAAATFDQVAALAGNAAYHGSSDPFEAYLGEPNALDAAMLAISAMNLAGADALADGNLSPDVTVVTDLESDPASSIDSLTLLGSRSAVDLDAAGLAAQYRKWLAGRKVHLPEGIDNLDPVAQAAVLGWMVDQVEKERVPWWESATAVGLHYGAAVLGAAGLATGIISIFLPPGADALGEGVGVGEDAAAGGAEAAAQSLSGAARMANISKSLDLGATVLAGGALGVDTYNQTLGGEPFDPVALALDGATFIPAAGAYATSLRLATLSSDLADLKALQAVQDSAQLRNQILAMKASIEVSEGVHAGLAWHSVAIGSGATAYSSLVLAAPGR